MIQSRSARAEQRICATCASGMPGRLRHSPPAKRRAGIEEDARRSSPWHPADAPALRTQEPAQRARELPGSPAGWACPPGRRTRASKWAATAHERIRLRPLRHRWRVGRGAGGAHRGRPRRQGGDRGGVSPRRHLRDPRLRAQEAAGLCQPLPRRLRGRGGLRLERLAAELRLADADRQQGRGDHAPRGPLPARPGARRRRPSCRRAPSWPTRTR